MSLTFEISELVHADLVSIWNYTAMNWSTAQADKYFNEIITQIQTICVNPQIGKSIRHIKKHHRKINVVSHMIIYKVLEERILIDRISHQRMEIE